MLTPVCYIDWALLPAAMAIQIFDQFNKKLFLQLLSPFGTVTANRAVLGGERTIDVLFEPNPETPLDPNELGNLANMSGKTALFEAFRSPLADNHVHNCFVKLFLLYSELQRQAEGTVPTKDLPQLWILAAEVSDILVHEFGGVPDSEQGEGFYRLPTRFRGTIVVIDELPNTPETLWLRLTGKGRTQEEAIAELLMLPESNPKRSPALGLLVSLRVSMEVLDEVEQEERRILMALSQAYLEWERETEQRGAARAKQETQRATMTSIMKTRFGSVDSQLEAIIPTLLELPIEESTRLLLQLSRDELLQRFSES
jgi:hypothetical protein